MKMFLFILFLTSGTAFSQTAKKESKQELKQIVADQLRIIDSLNTMLDESKAQVAEAAELIVKVQRENETLRKIMIDYVKQIDDLNTKNAKLAVELDKCADRK